MGDGIGDYSEFRTMAHLGLLQPPIMENQMDRIVDN